MEIHTDIRQIAQSVKRPVVAIGNFDGLHLAHQEIIKNCLLVAQEHDTKTLIITFDPHPAKVVNGHAQKQLKTLNEKLQMLANYKVDCTCVIQSDPGFMSLTWDLFIKKYLVDILHISHLVTGYNFRFGHKRVGDARQLAEAARYYGFGYQQINEVFYKHYSVSSSAIKTHLGYGSVNIAGQMLGEAYTISGVVVKGKGVACTSFNLPTANIELGDDLCFPAKGVYLVRVQIKSYSAQKYFGICNLGVRPTVTVTQNLTLEVHIFDFPYQELYGTAISVEFLTLIRFERKFGSLELLKKQITMDIEDAHYIINARLYKSIANKTA